MSWLKQILGRFGGRGSHVGAGRVQRSIEQRYNPMRQLTPENLSRWIDAFECGDLRPLARLLEAVSERDDMFKGTMRKAIRSVSRCDYDIRIEEGAEGSEAAKAHRDALVDFWRSVRATELLNQSAVGGVCRLVRQMMLAERDCHNVHELLWRVEGGKLRLTAVHVPLWMFENRTGHLRFLRDNFATYGEPLAPGEWMVHSGDGVGIACAIAASYKRLTLADWLAYSEHNATPGLHAKTDARQGSPEWQRCVEAVRQFAQDWAIVTGRDVDMTKVDLGAAGSLPYPPLVERMDKAIAALWRGSDLATVSSEARGASLQGEEMDLLEQSAAEDISETLHEQIDRFVVEYYFGAGTEPLARFALVPVSRPDVQKEILINEHLVQHGAKLSLADECQRFGRRQVEGAEEDRPMEAAQTQPAAVPSAAGEGRTPAGLRGLGVWNEAAAPEGREAEVARALRRDLRPVARAIAEGLKRRDFAGLKSRLDGILKECGTETAEAMERAMREAGGAAWDAASDKGRVTSDERRGEGDETTKGRGDEKGEGLAGLERLGSLEGGGVAVANENPYHCPKCGKFSGFNGHCDKCGYTLDADGSMKRAKRLLHGVEEGDVSRPIEALAYRTGLGQIDLDVGELGEGRSMDHGNGLAKIAQKHDREIANLPHALAHGKIFRLRPGNDPAKPFDDSQRAIVDGETSVFLERKGKDRWKITSIYTNSAKARKIERAAAE